MDQPAPLRRRSRVGRPSFSAGRTLSRAFKVFFANLVPILVLGSLALLPYTLFEMFFPYPLEWVGVDVGEPLTEAALVEVTRMGWVRLILSSLLSYSAGPLVAGAVTYLVFQQLRGRRASMGECVHRGLQHMIPIVVASIIVGIGIGVGLLLFWLPGLIVACMWWVVTPAIVVEKLGPLHGLGRSINLTKGQRLQVFLCIFLLGLIAVGLMMLVVVPVMLSIDVDLTGLVHPGPVYVGTVVVVTLLNMTLQGVASAVGYHDLRLHKEGIDEEELAAVFD